MSRVVSDQEVVLEVAEEQTVACFTGRSHIHLSLCSEKEIDGQWAGK